MRQTIDLSHLAPRERSYAANLLGELVPWYYPVQAAAEQYDEYDEYDGSPPAGWVWNAEKNRFVWTGGDPGEIEAPSHLLAPASTQSAPPARTAPPRGRRGTRRGNRSPL